MKNIFQSLGLIEVTETKEQTAVSAPVSQPNKQVVVNVTSTNNNQPGNVQITAEQISKFEQHFNDLFNNSNLPGPDYYEFLNMSDSMIEDGIPEQTAFKTVFKALGVQGLTKEYLLSTANQYVEITNKDYENFNSAIEKKINDQVGTRITKNEELSKSIIEKKNLITELQQDIITQENLIKENETEIVKVQQTIGANTQAYNMACNALKNKILEDITKIQTLIN